MLAKSDKSILPDGITLFIKGSQANLKNNDNKIAAMIPIQIAFTWNRLKLKKISEKLSFEIYFKWSQTTINTTIG